MIGWYVHHVGLGHTTRATAVASQLRHDVVGLGPGPRPPGWPGRGCRCRVPTASGARPPRPVQWRRGTTPASPTGTPARRLVTARLASCEVRGSQQCRLAATAPAHPRHDLAEALLAPWPAGTHEQWWPRDWKDKAWCVGAIGRFDGAPAPARPAIRRDAPRVLLLWGPEGRTATAEQVGAARTAAAGWEWVERRRGSGADDLAELHAADVVVTHAGLGALADVAAARRPAVVVAEPRPFDAQAASAHLLDRQGIAVGLDSWPTPSAWPWLLDRARALGGDGWHRWSSGRGAESAAEHLDSLADRLATTGGSSR